MMYSNDKYVNKFVAFLDILGFKRMIDSQSADDILNIFEVLTNPDDFRMAFHKASNEPLDSEPCDLYNLALEQLSSYVMSDSIVLSIPADVEYAMDVLVDACIYLQCMLYGLDTPVLLRGAISMGNHFQSDRVVFGKGMVNAFLYQENYSIYPRIIISGELLKKYTDISERDQKITMDQHDHYYYIDCLKEHFLGQEPDSKDCIRFEKMIDDILNSYEDIGVRKKYIWLKKRFSEIQAMKKAQKDGAEVLCLDEGRVF